MLAHHVKLNFIRVYQISKTFQPKIFLIFFVHFSGSRAREIARTEALNRPAPLSRGRVSRCGDGSTLLPPYQGGECRDTDENAKHRPQSTQLICTDCGTANEESFNETHYDAPKPYDSGVLM